MQTELTAAGASLQLGPLVFTNHRDVPQRVTALLPDNLQHRAGRDLAPNHHCEVPPDARKTGQRPGLRRLPPPGRKSVEEDLGHYRPTGKAKLGQPLRVHLSDDPDGLAVLENFPGASGVETGKPPRIRAGELGLLEV